MFIQYISQTIERVFLKTLRKSIFVDSYFFSYFHGFGEKAFNLQESVCEKICLATMHLQDQILFIRIILNIWRKFTFLFQLLSKFRENVICPMKA